MPLLQWCCKKANQITNTHSFWYSIISKLISAVNLFWISTEEVGGPHMKVGILWHMCFIEHCWWSLPNSFGHFQSSVNPSLATIEWSFGMGTSFMHKWCLQSRKSSGEMLYSPVSASNHVLVDHFWMNNHPKRQTLKPVSYTSAKSCEHRLIGIK